VRRLIPMTTTDQTTTSQETTTMTTTIDTTGFITIEVPSRFFDDHEDRALITESGEPYHADGDPWYVMTRPYLVATKKSTKVVRLHLNDVVDLLDDAVHYAGGHAYTETEFLGLVASARATVIRLAPEYGDRLRPDAQRDMRRILAAHEASKAKAAATRRRRAAAR
jgi:hypothetical protein